MGPSKADRPPEALRRQIFLQASNSWIHETDACIEVVTDAIPRSFVYRYSTRRTFYGKEHVEADAMKTGEPIKKELERVNASKYAKEVS